MKSSKVTYFSFILFWVLLLLLTLTTRFDDLANKPLHFDEGINGWFVMQMQTLGFYKYDATNYHGPLYFYLLQFFETLWGRSIETLRAVPATFSVLSVMIFSFGILRSIKMQRWMMLFFLLSPAFLFFGRSGIHEMPFVFFQILFALGFLRWFEKEDEKSLALILIGLWGMVTLKETFTITLVCWFLGLASLGGSTCKDLFSKEKIKKAWTVRITVLLLILLLLFVQLFTGFFKNMPGFVDFFKAITPWLKTGVEGRGHEKAFFYWFRVLWEAEPLVLLGVVMALPGMFSKDRALRLMSVFSVSQILIYSLIPYKTVWCILSLVWGFYFVIALTLVRMESTRRIFKVLTLTAVGVLVILGLRSAYDSVYRHPLRMEHPYIYVNSTYELDTLQKFIFAEAKKNPEILKSPVQLGMEEQWPWPWLLHSFTDMHYDLCKKRVIEKAWIYFCDIKDYLDMDVHLPEPYWKLKLSLRQSKEPSVIYLKKSVFPTVPFQDAEVVGEDK